MNAWQQLREQVWDRAQGHCEITGRYLGERGGDGYACHHRRPKGMGGSRADDTNTLSNLIAITHAIHNGDAHSVHLHPGWSRTLGYLLGQDQVPRLEPILLRGQALVLLTDDGRYLPLQHR